MPREQYRARACWVGVWRKHAWAGVLEEHAQGESPDAGLQGHSKFEIGGYIFLIGLAILRAMDFSVASLESQSSCRDASGILSLLSDFVQDFKGFVDDLHLVGP